MLYEVITANAIGQRLLRLAGAGESTLLVVVMLAAALMSAFMNNVAVAALLLPVAMDIVITSYSIHYTKLYDLSWQSGKMSTSVSMSTMAGLGRCSKVL